MTCPQCGSFAEEISFPGYLYILRHAPHTLYSSFGLFSHDWDESLKGPLPERTLRITSVSDLADVRFRDASGRGWMVRRNGVISKEKAANA